MEENDSELVLRVKVLDAEKDGFVYKYKIRTVTNMDKFSEPEMTTCRAFEDLEWLHWCIENQPNTDGIIVPPLPRRAGGPVLSTRLGSKLSQARGEESKPISVDRIEKCCKAVERYLQLLARHHVFSQNESLHQFLDTKELPPMLMGKKNWIHSLSHVVAEVRLHGREDVDKYFGAQRSFITASSVRLKEASFMFATMVESQWAVCTALGNLTSRVSLTGSSLSSGDPCLYRVLLKFGEGLDICKSAVEAVAKSDDLSVGFLLNLYEKYTLRAKAMLHHRSVLMQKMKTTERNAEKARPKNKEAADQAKEEALTHFTEMSTVAKQELTRFHEERVRSFKETLIELAESQISSGRESYAQLAKILTELTKMDVSS
ncbi:sorting nexin-6-like isoform X2 [Corticium candelabrum]|uniref:sorting nexin-6-like isoform X2 n=1 Tax=Corticium candelabrum TaxID=121492 RepID=UPI002E25B355|nr:sorting nexin-6-like isoform X2 [Corticium candelabrum]